MTDTPVRPRTGFVAIVGRPNVGKSTLVNSLVGEHLSITSRKPQTTRQAVRGVLTRNMGPQQVPTQFIFVDTPGFQKRHRTALNRLMNETVRRSLGEVDAIVLVIESRGFSEADVAVLNLLPREGVPVILALSKSDLLRERDRLLPVMADAAGRFAFAAIVPVSAEKGRQLDELLEELARCMPEGEPLFDADAFTDRSLRFLAAESLREKAFRLLGDELPYGVAVAIDRWQEDDTHVEIDATLLVARDSHKGIVIGKDGAKLREIGRLARADIAALVGKSVHLQTHVRVKGGWSDDARALKSLGYE
jgi:GTPase